MTDQELVKRYPVDQTSILITNDGSVIHPEKLGEGRQKVNLRLFARDSRDSGHTEAFDKLLEAILTVAIKMTGADPDKSSPDKISELAALIIAKHSDNRGYHNIFHIVDMIGDPGDAIWQAIGALTPDQIYAAPNADSLATEIMNKLPAQEPSDKQDCAENILAALTHDMYQKSDRNDIFVVDGHYCLKHDKSDVVLRYDPKGREWRPDESATELLLGNREDRKPSIEIRSLNKADEIFADIGIPEKNRRNIKIFTLTTEHEAFFGHNRPLDIFNALKEDICRGSADRNIVETMVRAYRFCRRDVSNFSARDSDGKADFLNFDGGTRSVTLGSGGVAREEATAADGTLISENPNRSTVDEILLWKGMTAVSERFLDKQKIQPRPLRLFFDPREEPKLRDMLGAGDGKYQDIDITAAIDEMDAHGREMFELLQETALIRVATCAIAEMAVSPHRRINSNGNPISARMVFDVIDEKKITEIDISTSGLNPKVAERLDMIFFYPDNAKTGEARMRNVLGLTAHGNPVFKGLPGTGDHDALTFNAMLGVDHMKEIAVAARSWINSRGKPNEDPRDITEVLLATCHNDEGRLSRLNGLIDAIRGQIKEAGIAVDVGAAIAM